ncbi:MAG: cell envelope integrity protein TolA [Nitrospirae bacterium]|nr:cell envelope integrity protein TolA [Nitrospirota bacterium]
MESRFKMESLQHSPPAVPGLPRAALWSAVVHGALFVVLAVLEAISPRPLVLRDVIQVNLVAPTAPRAPAAPAPAAEPSAPENPLWDKLSTAPAPAPPASSLGDEFKALAEMGRKGPRQPEQAPPPEKSDLAEWRRKQTPATAPVDQAPRAPEVKVDEPGLGDAWKKLSEKAERGGPAATRKDDELSRFWEKLAAGGERHAQAQAQGGTPQYLAAVERRISARWSPPDIFGPKAKGTVVVFPVLRDGTVGPVRVVNSSGSDAFDEAAVRAVLLSAPFARFPEAMREARIDVRFTFALTGAGP